MLSRGLYGRADELAQLSALLERARQGQGAFALVVGEPGIGKSRLLHELAQVARDRDMQVAWGRAWEAGGAPAHWPWAQVFRTLGSNPLAGLEPSADSSERFALFQRVARVISDSATSQPLLIVLDDLHVADVSSLLMLLFVVRELGSARVAVVAAARETYANRNPEISVLLGRLKREAHVLSLVRLGRGAVAEWARAALGSLDVDPEELHRVSDGNPLFIEELLRLSGRPGPAHWLLAQVIDEHLASLSPKSRVLLEVASVLGREFTLEALCSAFNVHADETAELLVEATQLGVLIPSEAKGYTFSHALLRDRFYEALPPTRRAELHWNAGASISSAVIAAHHLLLGARSGDTALAARVARDAARAMLDQLAYEETEGLVVQAQAVIEHRSGVACELAILGAEAAIRAGKGGPGRAACKAAAALAVELDEPELLARAALVYGTELLSGVVDGAMVELLRAALQRLSPEPCELRVRVMARLASASSPAPDAAELAEVRELANGALEQARQLGDKDLLLYCLMQACAALAYGVPFAEHVALVNEAVALARQLGRRLALERLLAMHVCLLIEAGRRAEANVERRAFEEVVQNMPPAHHWRLRGLQFVMALLDGRFDAAKSLSDEARLKAGPDSPATRVWPAQRIALAMASGQLAFIGDDAEELSQLPPTAAGGQLTAWVLAARGRFSEAAIIVHESFSRVCDFPTLLATSALCVLLQDRALAERAFAALVQSYSGNQMFWAGNLIFGSRDRILGDLARLLGKNDVASRFYDAAIELYRRMDAKPLLELALRGREALGARPVSAKPRPASRFGLRRDGDVWAVEADGAIYHLRHSKGLAYLNQLLQLEGREVHVLMLVGVEHGVGDAGAILAHAQRPNIRRASRISMTGSKPRAP